MTDRTAHSHPEMIALLEGVRDFGDRVFPAKRALFDQLAAGQSPHTLLITCADSRVSPSMITQQPPGEIFVLRNIGNIVPAYGEMLGGVSAAIEYAVLALRVKHIVVCGHSDCGAMKAMRDPAGSGLDQMPTVSSWLRNAAAAQAVCATLHPGLEGDAAVNALAEQNVLLQLDHLRSHPAVASAVAAGRLMLMGWLYDIATGRVGVFDGHTRQAGTIEAALAGLRNAAS